jgi:hypothetical protein
MSTANNRLEIVGVGENAVTFRLIENDIDYNPMAQTGLRNVLGRKSTRPRKHNLGNVNYIKVTLHDPVSKTDIIRFVDRKQKNWRNGATKAGVEFGELAQDDYFVYTDLSRAVQSEAGPVYVAADSAEPVVHHYPNIIATRYGGYDAVNLAAGATEFNAGASHADSPFVSFLSGNALPAGAYELKQKGGGEGTVMFRLKTGAPGAIKTNRVLGTEQGTIETNKKYVLHTVLVQYNNGTETFSNIATGALPIESSVEIDQKMDLERRIREVLRSGNDATFDGFTTTAANVQLALADPRNDFAAYKALRIYDTPDLANNLMFVSGLSVTLGAPDVDTGLTRKDGTGAIDIPDSTEVIIDMLNLPDFGTEGLFSGKAPKDVAFKTFFQLEVKASIESNLVTYLAEAVVQNSPADDKDRRENVIYRRGNKLYYVAPKALIKQKDIDFKVSISVNQDFADGTAALVASTVRKTLNDIESTEIHDRAGAGEMLILQNMDGHNNDPQAATGGSITETLVNLAKANTMDLVYATVPGVGVAGETLLLNGTGTFGDTAKGAHAGATAPAVLLNSSDILLAGANSLEIAADAAVDHKQMPQRTELISNIGMSRNNIAIAWKHTRPAIRLTDKGEKTKLNALGARVLEVGGDYRRARSSEGFRVRLEKSQDAGANELAPTHYLVLWKEQTRSQYMNMLSENSVAHHTVNKLIANGWQRSGITGQGDTLPKVGDFYAECNINIDAVNHGKSFTILGCYGREESGEMIWGDMGELGRDDSNDDPDKSATNFFQNVGPQMYIDEAVLSSDFNVKMSNRVTASDRDTWSNVNKKIYDKIDMEVSCNQMDSLVTGDLVNQVNALIGLTGKRPDAATATGLDTASMRNYIDSVRAYVRLVVAEPAAARIGWVDPTGRAGITGAIAAIAHRSLKQVADDDLTVMAKVAALTGGGAPGDYTNMSVLGVAFGGANANATTINKADYDQAITVMNQNNNGLVMQMLYKLKKLEDVLLNNPDVTNAATSTIITKPPPCPLNPSVLLDGISRFIAAKEQIKQIHMWMECADVENTAGSLGRASNKNSDREGKNNGGSTGRDSRLMNFESGAAGDIGREGINLSGDNVKYVAREVEDGINKYLQIQQVEFSIGGRAQNITAKHKNIYKGNYQAGPAVGGVTKRLGGTLKQHGVAGDVTALNQLDTDTSLFSSLDNQRKVGNNKYRPSLSQPFFIRTIALGSDGTNGAAAAKKLDDLYATMHATEFANPGKTLSSSTEAKLEVSLTMLDASNTLAVINAAAAFNAPDDGNRARTLEYLLDDKMKIAANLSTKLHVSVQDSLSTDPIEYTLPTEMKQRKYKDDAVGTDLQKQKEVGGLGADAATYELVATIPANFKANYNQTIDRTPTNYADTRRDITISARVHVGASQKVLGPIRGASAEYGPAPAAAGAWGPVKMISFGTADDAVDDQGDAIDNIDHKNGHPRVPASAGIASYGAVPCIGTYELATLNDPFRPWNLDNTQLGTISAQQDAADEKKVSITVVESSVNKYLEAGTSPAPPAAAVSTAYTLDVDHGQMFVVKVAVREFQDEGEAQNAWSGELILKPPNHGLAVPETKYVTDNFTFDVGGGTGNGWDAAGAAFNTAVGTFTNELLPNKRLEFKFQQYANVAVAAGAIVYSAGTGTAGVGVKGAAGGAAAVTTAVAIGEPKYCNVVYNKLVETINTTSWEVDLKNKDPNLVNTVVVADKFDLFRIESEELNLLGAAANNFKKPADSLVNTHGTANPDDDKLSSWVSDVYHNANVDIVIQVEVVDKRHALTGAAIAPNKFIDLDKVSGLKLVPKVASDVQSIIDAEGKFIVRTTVNGSTRAGSAVSASDPSTLNKPTEYNHLGPGGVGTLADSNIQDSWLLMEGDKKWRQKTFGRDLAEKFVKQGNIISTRIVLRPDSRMNRGRVSEGFFSFTSLSDANNKLFTNGSFPIPKLSQDPLQLSNSQLTGPRIVKAANIPAGATAAVSVPGRIMEIPIRLSSDNIKQVNIMIAHSDDAEAYFNNLRSDGAFVRAHMPANATFTDFAAAVGAGATVKATKGAIPLADSVDTLFELSCLSDNTNLKSVDWVIKTNLGADITKMGDYANAKTEENNIAGLPGLDTADAGLFFIEKCRRKGTGRDDAGFELQIDAAGDVKAACFGDYILSAAIPARGNCKFLLINVETENGNSAWIPYHRDGTDAAPLDTFSPV